MTDGGRESCGDRFDFWVSTLCPKVSDFHIFHIVARMVCMS